MSDSAIRVEDLGKLYRIGGKQERYKTLRDTFAGALTSPFHKVAKLYRRNGNHDDSAADTIWAVKNLRLEISRGDVTGIIGRNGAGKSTLLKILSRITEPTTGYAEIRGRVGSLLEVGTGFHPELTGRENIYLNGAILGMRREEINRKFDEIVTFSEVEKFIDTPVKRYSSGMHMRLAFSVAAHLQTEILLIDEVLAVGDIAFQKKCLGKMEDVAAHGKTVVFVSHNLAAIKELCRTAIVLGDGKLEFQGPVVEGLARYSQQFIDAEEHPSVKCTGWGPLQLGGRSNDVATTISGAASFKVQASLEIRESFDSGRLFCKISDSVGNPVVLQRVDCSELWDGKLVPGRYLVSVVFPPLWLAPGVYSVSFKFVGHKFDQENENHSSGQAVLDVIGKTNGKSRASLSPALEWALSETLPATEQDGCFLSDVAQSSLSKTINSAEQDIP
jgi:lipopolysaccharide transport system ATP-binding protein